MPESSRIQVQRLSGCFPESKEQSLNFGCSFEACDEPSTNSTLSLLLENAIAWKTENPISWIIKKTEKVLV